MAYAWMDSRFTRAPENDEGTDFDESEEGLDAEGLEDDALDGDDDEGEGDSAGAEEGEGEEAAPRSAHDEQVGRRKPANDTIRELRRQQQELRRELEAVKSRPAPQQQPQETPAQRQARLDAMDPEDRIRFEVNEQVGGLRREFATLSFQMQDSGDRTAFESLCARNPVAAKLQSQVEDRLAEMRASGTTAPRETVLKYVIGDRALANAARAGTKARKTAAANITRQTARPGSARGDAPAENRRGAKSLAERLEGVKL